MRRVTFDLDCLRSFAMGIELGSFSRAAERLGRSTSAISAQLKKLEDQAETPLVKKAGRGLVLTEAGEMMLGYARRMLDLNDEAAQAVRDTDLAGWIRLGVQEDFGEFLLPGILGVFARAHPHVKIDVRIARNADLMDGIASGGLDLALAWAGSEVDGRAQLLGEVPMRWLGPANQAVPWDGKQPLPLVTFEAPCLVRTSAIMALDRAGIAWRTVFTSPSLGGIWAAVAAGLGIAVRTSLGLPEQLRILDDEALGLPALPALSLMLHRADTPLSETAQRLADIILQQLSGVITAASCNI